jgi:hypothetical protein
LQAAAQFDYRAAAHCEERQQQQQQQHHNNNSQNGYMVEGLASKSEINKNNIFG